MNSSPDPCRRCVGRTRSSRNCTCRTGQVIGAGPSANSRDARAISRSQAFSCSTARTTAARLAGCNQVVYASSVAVSGEQKFYGDRMVNEDDFKHGHVQYAMHKIFNEWQAQDYREKHGMEITTIRPANVTGPDKVVGSVDHVFCITNPARGKPANFPYKDTMRAPIHVDEIAEIFARVVTKDKPDHAIYNTGGHTIS